MRLEYKYKISKDNKTTIKEYIDSDKFIIELNDNEPAFTDDDKKQLEGSVIPFSDLDELGRCGTAFAYISEKTCSKGQDDRPSIQSNPTGFPSEKENFVNNKSIFQHCHLIGYHLFAKKNDKDDNKNANLKRIFTGTRFMNNVMFYYEKKIAKYVDGTENHVLYRCTPYFEGDNKLAYGVQMEAKFINEKNEEDKKSSFNIFVYNKQPCIAFDYETGEIFTDKSKDLSKKMLKTKRRYILNEKNKKFHIESCASVYDIKNKNEVTEKGVDLIQGKCCPCEICIPY